MSFSVQKPGLNAAVLKPHHSLYPYVELSLLLNEGSGTTIYDSSPNGFDGTLDDGQSGVGWDSWAYGDYLDFYDTPLSPADHILIPSITVYPYTTLDLVASGERSLEVWLWVDSLPGYGRYAYLLDKSGTYYVAIGTAGGGLVRYWYKAGDGSSSAAYNEVGISTGAWHQLVFTHDASLITLYWDGSFVAAWISTGVSSFYPWYDLQLGCPNPWTPNPVALDGRLGLVRLYSTALDQADVTELWGDPYALYYVPVTLTDPVELGIRIRGEWIEIEEWVDAGVVSVGAAVQPATVSISYDVTVGVLEVGAQVQSAAVGLAPVVGVLNVAVAVQAVTVAMAYTVDVGVLAVGVAVLGPLVGPMLSAQTVAVTVTTATVDISTPVDVGVLAVGVGVLAVTILGDVDVTMAALEVGVSVVAPSVVIAVTGISVILSAPVSVGVGVLSVRVGPIPVFTAHGVGVAPSGTATHVAITQTEKAADVGVGAAVTCVVDYHGVVETSKTAAVGVALTSAGVLAKGVEVWGVPLDVASLPKEVSVETL